MTSAALTQQQIRALLTELGADLHVRGIRAELFVVGGAAMSLAYNTRRATQDIDAVFEPKTEIVAAAERVAARHGLPDNWLNDAVKGFLPGPDPRQRAILSAPGINVSVPSPEYLLALKVAAARVDRDADDIRELARICGARSADDVLRIAEEILGGRQPVLPKTQFLVQEMFPAAPSRRTQLTKLLRSWAARWRRARAARRSSRDSRP